MASMSGLQASSEVFSTPPADDLAYSEYRSISKAAIFSLLLGLLGLLAMVWQLLLLLPLVGLLLGLIAFRALKKFPLELTGRPIAWAGVLLNALLLVAAPARHAYVYATEVPEGYQRISFSSLKSPLGAADVPPQDAFKLDGQKIFLKGYVHPTSVSTATAKNFVLVPDWATCCFGGQPPLTHMVEVTLVGDLAVRASTRQIKLAGTLQVAQDLKPISGLQGVYYQLRADHLQ
jgi:hypothetical protein